VTYCVIPPSKPTKR